MSNHPKEAIEAVARALAENYFDGRRDPMNPHETYDWAGRDDAHKAGWKLAATALLDQIAPMLTRAALDRADADRVAAVDALELLEIVNLLDVLQKPDERLCCDGRECGCMGSTAHEQAEHYALEALREYAAAIRARGGEA